MNRQAYLLSVKAALGAELPDRPVHQVGSEELLLSRPAERIPDQPVRHAAEPRRASGHPRPGTRRPVAADPGSSAHLEEDAGKSMHDEEAGKADSRIDLNRARHAASGNRQPARLAAHPPKPGLPYRTEAAAELPRRVRLQHAGRQPAGRRQRQPSCRHARGKGRHADCGSEEHEQLPRGGRAWPTKPSGNGTCGKERGKRSETCPSRPAAGTKRRRSPGPQRSKEESATLRYFPDRTWRR